MLQTLSWLELTCLGGLWPCLDPPQGCRVPRIPCLKLLHLALDLSQVGCILLSRLHASTA